MGVWDFVRETARERRRFTKDLTIEQIGYIPRASDVSLQINKWYRVDDAVAVFADLKGSTQLSAARQARVLAKIYELFTGAWITTLRAMKSGFIDIKGDGGFGLFYGKAGVAQAILAGVTFRTIIERELKVTAGNMLSEIAEAEGWEMSAKVGIHKGSLLVKRVGVRDTAQHRLNWLVWAGKPVNYASKLSSLAGANEMLITDPVFQTISNKEVLRRHLRDSCGCNNAGVTSGLWTLLDSTHGAPMLNGSDVYSLKSLWCARHGDEFFDAVKEYVEEKLDIKLGVV